MENYNHLVKTLSAFGNRIYKTEFLSTLETQIEKWLLENELNQSDLIPDWTVSMFEALTTGQPTDWVDFTRPDFDDTPLFDFLKGLGILFPMGYENNGESWLLCFPLLEIEACISLEGSCYKVSSLGKTWD